MIHFKQCRDWPDKKTNVRYAEYLCAKRNDKTCDQTPMDKDEFEDILGTRVLEYVLAHNLTMGFKIYGKKGEHASKKELKQLHDMATF